MSHFGRTSQEAYPPSIGLRPQPVSPPEHRKTSKLLEWCGLLAIAFVIVAAGGVTAAMVEGSRLDAESKAFADASMAAIVPMWSEGELRSRASPELAATPPDQMDAAFDMFRGKLGVGAQFDACRGQSNVTLWLDKGAVVSAVYDCDVHAPSGPATVELTMKQYDGAWKLVGFHVNIPPSSDGGAN